MTDSPHHWPFDYDSLKKGDLIQVATIEEYAEAKCGSKQYQFACMALISEIRKRRSDLVMKQDKDCIRILTDSESVDYYELRHSQRMKGHKRDISNIFTRIDPTRVDNGEMERAIGVNRRALCVIAEEKRQKRLLKLKGKSDEKPQLPHQGNGASPDAQQPAGEPDEPASPGDSEDLGEKEQDPGRSPED